MAAGDFDGATGSIANNATIDIKPGEDGIVWSLKEVGITGAWELYSYNGTTLALIDTFAGSKTLTNRQMIVTYGKYYRIKNVSGASKSYHYRYGVLK